MRRWLWMLASVGCMGGPNLETRIGELRVVAAKAEPAAVKPGEAYDLRLWVADPLALGAEVLTWSCPDQAGDCLPQTSSVPTPSEGITPSFVQRRIAAPAPVWVLACPDGTCGDLDNPTADQLRDPFGWLQDLPLAGVSAGSRLPPVALDPTAEPPVNPTIQDAPKAMLDREAIEVELSFSVEGATDAFGYATSGGFESPSNPVDDKGTVTLTWVPDPEDEDGEAYVVFTNGSGGTEVWQAPIP
ncbi:MAG: hypothetical protein AAGA48_38295 [Myxococcota bacterium]